jgi:hypothetical protein
VRRGGGKNSEVAGSDKNILLAIMIRKSETTTLKCMYVLPKASKWRASHSRLCILKCMHNRHSEAGTCTHSRLCILCQNERYPGVDADDGRRTSVPTSAPPASCRRAAVPVRPAKHAGNEERLKKITEG